MIIQFLKKYLSRKNFSYICYVMSPLFPGNNWAEIIAITAIISWISPLFPQNTNLGLVRVYSYLVYNIVGMGGFFILRVKKDKKISKKDLFEISYAFIFLFISGLIPEPVLTIILILTTIYFFKDKLKQIWCKVSG